MGLDRKPRWFDEHGAISLGCQISGPEAKHLMTPKKDLDDALKGGISSTHCSAIDHYALVLRVGGLLGEYPAEKTHRIRRSRAQRLVSADIDIPSTAWQGRDEAGLRAYLASRVEEALRLIVNRLQRDGEDLDWSSFETEIDDSLRAFRVRQ